MHHCRMIEGTRTTTVKSETETFTDHCPISGVERQELSLQLSVTGHKHVRNIRAIKEKLNWPLQDRSPAI